jgi:hypothetical protein
MTNEEMTEIIEKNPHLNTKAQESLPTISGSTGGSGLSERNEFYRQLVRLRDEHEVAIIGSSKRMHANDSEGASIWDKMATHRVTLHHVAEGTGEQRKGCDFVVTVKSNITTEIQVCSLTL